MSNINNILKILDLQPNEIKIFRSILNGQNTPLGISRSTTLSRSKVYKILETLEQKSLVNKQAKPYGTKYFPPSEENITQIIQNLETNKNKQIESLLSLQSHIANIDYEKGNKPIILNYKGIEGFKRVNWNSTKAIDSLRIYEFDTLTSLSDDYNFAEEVRLEFSKKKNFKIKQLTNLKEFPDYTNIPAIVTITEARYIPKEILNISTEVMIYNNIVTSYEQHPKTAFIVEIQNKNYASMQKQLFDISWKIAKPLTNISKFGAAKIV